MLLAGVALLTVLAGVPQAPRAPGRDLRAAPPTPVPATVVDTARNALSARPDPSRRAPPPCLAGVCQPRVSVPGFEPRFVRASRTELAVAYLDRMHVEPLASIGRALVATGLRIDYTPPGVELGAHAPGGWGAVFAQVRFRLDADNVPVLAGRTHR
jgi:hypothetical protein